MENIKVRIFVSLAAALAAHANVHGSGELVLDQATIEALTDSEREELIRLNQGSRDLLDLPAADCVYVIPALRALIAKREAEAAKREAEAAQRAADARREAEEIEGKKLAALALPDADWITTHYYNPGEPILKSDIANLHISYYRSDPRIAARIESIKSGLLADQHAAWEAELQAKEAAKQAEISRRKSAEREAILIALRAADSRTPDLATTKRFEAGMLPYEEKNAALRDHYLGGIDGKHMPRRTSDEVEHEEYCCNVQVSWHLESSEGPLTATEWAEWERLNEIGKTLGGAYNIELMDHHGECKCGGKSPYLEVARVTWACDELSVSRRFLLS